MPPSMNELIKSFEDAARQYQPDFEMPGFTSTEASGGESESPAESPGIPAGKSRGIRAGKSP
jgi:hypothetical protein